MTPRDQSMAIVRRVAREYLLPVDEVLGPSRTKRAVASRKEAMQRLVDERDMSSSQIGRLFNRDHTTVLHALGRLSRRREIRP